MSDGADNTSAVIGGGSAPGGVTNATEEFTEAVTARTWDTT